MAQDSSPEYWDMYTNLQRVKHQLISEYLKGWFPKLGFSFGRIVYFDTHAGKGEHSTGESGSPIVALETLLTHEYRDRILTDCEVGFNFIEHDEENVAFLQEKIDELDDIPEGVNINISYNNCFDRLHGILTSLEERSSRIAPAFGFIDPYGFKIPHNIVRDLMSHDRVELFINIIWRELDMAISQAIELEEGGMVDTLNSIFGGGRWRELRRELPHAERADMAVEILREEYGARWATSIRMLGDNNATRYVLVHFTNNDSGRELMKDCLWKVCQVCPEESFFARRSDNPGQAFLIEPTQDFSVLETWLDDQLAEEPVFWSDLEVRLRSTLWRKTHLWKIIAKRRRENRIEASEYEGRFSQKADPLLSLPAPEEE